MTHYKVIGLMSGTSLDGVDLAYCHFEKDNETWKFQIFHAETIGYPDEWKTVLQKLPSKNASELIATDTQYGHYLGEIINSFILKYQLDPVFIASHGHTIFHQPDQGFTLQIGNGAAIAAVTGKTVICDFRTTDVALKGQGAPLVPIGDRHLFGKYTYCLNLGGIANISFEKNGKRIAFDICPANMAFNYLCKELDVEYDKDGENASGGQLDMELYNALNALNFYQAEPPKSLGREWFESTFLTVLNQSSADVYSKLRTVAEHIAFQISKSIGKKSQGSVLITGGGAHNGFLIRRIKDKLRATIVIPDDLIIDFKEALIFAFLGVLRVRDEVNCLSSVTGATSDNVGGAIFSGTRSK